MEFSQPISGGPLFICGAFPPLGFAFLATIQSVAFLVRLVRILVELFLTPRYDSFLLLLQ